MCPAIVDTRDARGATALMTAASMSHLLVVRRLIDARAAVNSPDYKGRTPLITAVGVGAFEVVEALCSAGANFALTGDRGRSALHAAVEYNSVDIVRVLIDHGVNINAQDSSGRTALHLAVESQVSSSDACAHHPARTLLARSALSHAPQHVHCAAMLLRAGADLSIPDSKACAAYSCITVTFSRHGSGLHCSPTCKNSRHLHHRVPRSQRQRRAA